MHKNFLIGFFCSLLFIGGCTWFQKESESPQEAVPSEVIEDDAEMRVPIEMTKEDLINMDALNNAMQQYDETLCEESTDDEKKEICMDSIYFAKAELTFNEKYCEKISYDSWKQECIERLKEYSFFKTADKKSCDLQYPSTEQEELREKCLYMSEQSRLKEGFVNENNLSACTLDELLPNYQIECVAEIITSIAMQTKNPEVCFTIKSMLAYIFHPKGIIIESDFVAEELYQECRNTVVAP